MDDLIPKHFFVREIIVMRDGAVTEMQVGNPFLSDAAKCWLEAVPAAALTEAQETIARQQVMLDRALENGGDLMIENARLREALRWIEARKPSDILPTGHIGQNVIEHGRAAHDMWACARAALSQQSPGEPGA